MLPTDVYKKNVKPNIERLGLNTKGLLQVFVQSNMFHSKSKDQMSKKIDFKL